ncbi:MAG TPA: hypothetical protein VNS80_08810 [Pseudolysinimonas sp.]|nr:hypothetical protein [Pseudolysinimonas sp.]
MSTDHIESASYVENSALSAEIMRIAMRRSVGSMPAAGQPYATRLSVELEAVIARWLRRARRGIGMPPAHPSYRRNLL